MLSSRSLVVTPPAAENLPGLPPAASTRWHGTMIGNGFIRGVRLRSRHVHFLEQPAPDPTISLRQRRAAPIQMHFVGKSLLRAVQRLRRSGALVRGRMPGAWNCRTRHEMPDKALYVKPF